MILTALTWAPSAQAIVGGTSAAIEDYPHQVRVLVNVGSQTFGCGGSIRDSTHVITAAHCVYGNGRLATPSSVTVGYGSDTIGGLAGAGVSEVTIPSKYASQPSYDVALLDLSAPLSGYGGPKVNRIPVASESTLDNALETQDAVATGWGATMFDGNASSNLLQVDLPLRTDLVCSGTYGSYYVGERTVCAGGEGGSLANDNPDTCQGDSGGPLALDTPSGQQLVGITSYGDECGLPATPGAYTQPSDDEIGALIAGTATATLKGSAGVPAARAPAATTPISQTVPPPAPVTSFRDTIRPRARVSSVSCKRTRCSFRVAARDSSGRVARLSVKVSRRVRSCVRRGGKRVCRYVTRTRKLTARRVSGGFSARARLVPGSYKLTAVAADGAGNRSRAVSRAFRVRR